MLKAVLTKATGSGEQLVILGLSRLNCEKLLEGRPIHIELSLLGLPTTLEVLLVGGETEEAIRLELEKGLAGEKSSIKEPETDDAPPFTPTPVKVH